MRKSGTKNEILVELGVDAGIYGSFFLVNDSL